MPIQFYVDKVNATMADSLTTLGLAAIVSDLLEFQVGSPTAYSLRIYDKGHYYALECDPELAPETVQRFNATIMPIKLIRTLKNREALSAIDDHWCIDYEREKQQRNSYFEFLQKTGGGKHVPTEQSLLMPHPDWDIFRAINPAALPGYNNILLDWRKALSAQAEVLNLLLGMFLAFPNSYEQAEKQWKTLDKAHGWGIAVETTTLQLYNPDQGKGQNRTKANALGMGNVKGFWLLEFLKIVGLYHAGITRLLRGVKDRKTYVIAPINIDYQDAESILTKFKHGIQVARPSIASDIMTVINYARSMLEFAAERESFFDKLLQVKHLRNIVGGFYTAFYKDLGNAVVTMNLSFIALPNWIEIKDNNDVSIMQEVLSEVEKLIWTIDESHSDGYTLLDSLRDFISGNVLTSLFNFTAAYAGYYMGRRERNQYAHQLSTDCIRSIVVGTDEKLAPIFDNQGFKNIAYAIRQSTVTAQYRKAQNDRRYDIRYGLGQELARKGRYPQEFITALADFLHKYNAENAQVAERARAVGRSGPFRRNVMTSDIEAVVKLIDEYGAPMIANLLIAYGYARVSSETPDTANPIQQTQAEQLEQSETVEPSTDYE